MVKKVRKTTTKKAAARKSTTNTSASNKSTSKKGAAKKTAPSGLLDNRLAGAVKESAQQIWLAGMGAFAKAQAEGGKVFDTLVKEGTRLQRKTKSVAEDGLGEVTGRVSAMASDVSSKAGASWDKLEGIFEDRTAKALAKLGVPTAREVSDLARRVDDLAAAIAKLGKPARKTTANKVLAANAPARKTPKPVRKTSTRGSASSAAVKATPARKT